MLNCKFEIFQDDEILARGEEWQITHVQYLFLEGSTGPPLNSCHFAHFVSLIRRDLIGSCQLQQQRGQPSPNLNVLPNRRGACNCVLKRRFRDSLMNRCSSNCDDPSLLSCDCSKPLVVQCLLVSRTFYLHVLILLYVFHVILWNAKGIVPLNLEGSVKILCYILSSAHQTDNVRHF